MQSSYLVVILANGSFDKVLLAIAGELAVAMSAAAEAALPDDAYLSEAQKGASVIWNRFAAHLLNVSEHSLQKPFVLLMHQLRMDELAVQIADRLKVWTHQLMLLMTDADKLLKSCHKKICLQDLA